MKKMDRLSVGLFLVSSWFALPVPQMAQTADRVWNFDGHASGKAAEGFT